MAILWIFLEMFPVLFVEAFNRRLLNILKAMARIWPFNFLLGTLSGLKWTS